jgi:hypothetical protein
MRPVGKHQCYIKDNIKINLGEMDVKVSLDEQYIRQYMAVTRLPDTCSSNRKTLSNIR